MDLPVCIWILIFNLLPISDLGKLAVVCKKFNRIFTKDENWVWRGENLWGVKIDTYKKFKLHFSRIPVIMHTDFSVPEYFSEKARYRFVISKPCVRFSIIWEFPDSDKYFNTYYYDFYRFGFILSDGTDMVNHLNIIPVSSALKIENAIKKFEIDIENKTLIKYEFIWNAKLLLFPIFLFQTIYGFLKFVHFHRIRKTITFVFQNIKILILLYQNDIKVNYQKAFGLLFEIIFPPNGM